MLLRKLLVTLLVAAVSLSIFARHVTAADPPSAEAIAKLIKQLDDPIFEKRDEAQAELLKIGSAAREAIEKAGEEAGASAEFRVRVNTILKKIHENQPVKLADVVAQAKLANRGKLDKKRLEQLIVRLNEICTTAQKNEPALNLSIPLVALSKDLKKVDGVATFDLIDRGSLITFETGRFSTAVDSIILAEGAVDIDLATNCIIIAGQAAQIKQSSNCLVVAGHDVQSVNATRGIFLSGGILHSHYAYSNPSGVPLIGAARQMVIGYGESARLINALNIELKQPPPPTPSRGRGGVVLSTSGNRAYTSEALDLMMPEQDTSLSQHVSTMRTIKMKYAEIKDSEDLLVFRRKDGDGEYVIRPFQEIKFPDGKPMPEFAGWQLIYCSIRNYALFKKGDEYSIVRSTPTKR